MNKAVNVKDAKTVKQLGSFFADTLYKLYIAIVIQLWYNKYSKSYGRESSLVAPVDRGGKLRAESLLYAIRRHDAECI